MKKSPISTVEEITELASAVDNKIEAIAGEKIHFAVFIFHEDGSRYIGSCSHEQVVREIRKFLGLWGSGMSDLPAHQVN